MSRLLCLTELLRPTSHPPHDNHGNGRSLPGRRRERPKLTGILARCASPAAGVLPERPPGVGAANLVKPSTMSRHDGSHQLESLVQGAELATKRLRG